MPCSSVFASLLFERWRSLRVTLFGFSLLCLFGVFAASAEVLWTADHETGDISQWDRKGPWQSGPGSTNYLVTTGLAHTGRYSLASTIDTTSGKAGIRWARRYMPDGSKLLPDEAYYSVWFYMPGPFRSSWWNFMQWKRADGKGGSDPVASVNFEQRASGAQYFSLNYKVGDDGGYKTKGWGNIASSDRDVPLRQWVHLECKYRWSIRESGEITCWQDGVEIWSFDGIKTEFDYRGAGEPRQFAVNAYGEDISPSPYTFYLDDAAISSSRLSAERSASSLTVLAADAVVSPGSILSIYGSGFTAGSRLNAAGVPLPFDLGGTSVTLGGEPAPLFAVWPEQIVLQVPWRVGANINPTGSPTFLTGEVRRGSVAEPVSVRLAAASPSVFTFNGAGSGQAVALFANSSTYVAPESFFGDSRPANPGDIVVLYTNGLGPVTPFIESGVNSCEPAGVCDSDYGNLQVRRTVLDPEVRLGSRDAPPNEVLFAGLDPTYVGLYQVYFVVGQGTQSSSQTPLHVRVGQAESQPNVTIAVD